MIRLLDIYGFSSLEDVFLDLCIKEDQDDKNEDQGQPEVSVISKPEMYPRFPPIASALKKK